MEEEKKMEEGKKEAMSKNKMANVILLGGVFFAVGFFVSQGNLLNKEQKTYITLEEAQEKAENFITENLVQPGTEIKVKGASEERGLYKVVVTVQEQEIETYMTKDGKSFFPQAMNIEEIEEQKNASQEDQAVAPVEVPKQDKPVVETFIMSYCPYGTQVQKGFLPVVQLLKDKIDFDFKFVDYAMHEKDEIDENLVQYCINEDNQQKYYKYLDCFLVSEDSESCLAKAQVNQAKLNQCVVDVDNKYGVIKAYEDKESWGGQFPPFDIQKEDNLKYGVQGSPTIIINGVEASSARDPQSLLATICSGFEEMPVECNQELSTETPAPGFGSGATDSNVAADCAE
jgi:glutaredoxin